MRTTISDDDPFAVLEDPRIATVRRRLYGAVNRQNLSIIRHFLPHTMSHLRRRFMPFSENEMAGFYADKYIAIIEDQGAFAYLTARALRARTVVEFGTSFGLSTLWLAAAVRANGGGRVVTTEIVPDKARIARRNFEDAGLADLIEVREGEARNIPCADNCAVRSIEALLQGRRLRQSHHGRRADQCAACETEDLPPDRRRDSLAGHAMHERVARHGGGRSEYQRQCDPQDRGAQHGKQKRQNAERCCASNEADNSGSEPSGSGAIGEARNGKRQHERQRVDRQRMGEDAHHADQHDGCDDQCDHVRFLDR